MRELYQDWTRAIEIRAGLSGQVTAEEEGQKVKTFSLPVPDFMVFRCKLLMAAGNNLANYERLREYPLGEGVKMMFALDAINQTVGKV